MAMVFDFKIHTFPCVTKLSASDMKVVLGRRRHSFGPPMEEEEERGMELSSLSTAPILRTRGKLSEGT